MAVATRLKWYLDTRELEYGLIHHTHSKTSIDSARAAHVPTGRVAKCVLLEDERGYVLAILPASCRVSLAAIEDQLHRELQLASESELAEVFPDCELGAVPPTGTPYNIPTLVDDSLLRLPDVYLEAGDHEELLHMSAESFQALVATAAHGRFSVRH